MPNDHEPGWLRDVERFGAKYLIKLILAVLSLFFLVVLVSNMPGIERLSDALWIPFDALISVVVTAAVLVLFYRIAHELRDLVTDIEMNSEGNSRLIGAIGYWGVILLSLLIAYETFSAAGRPLFALAGFEVFYPMFFILLAMIPLALLGVEAGIYLQMSRDPEREDEESPSQRLKTVEEQVYGFLEENGGTASQGEVTTETGWSKSKTSRILSDMESEGWIVRYQVGREKIVCLPGSEPRFVASDRDDSQPR